MTRIFQYYQRKNEKHARIASAVLAKFRKKYPSNIAINMNSFYTTREMFSKVMKYEYGAETWSESYDMTPNESTPRNRCFELFDIILDCSG